MLNIVDPFTWSDHRKILTSQETGIAALQTFGICSNTHAGQPIGTHIHRDCIEIVYLVKGFQIYEAENARFNLSGSDIFVSYPNEPHSSGQYPESVCDIIWMQINLRPDLPFFGLDESHAEQLRNILRSLPRVFTGNPALENALHRAFFSLASKDPLERLSGEQLLVCALLQMKKLSLQVHLRHSDSIGDAIAYIHAHLSEPISLETAADCCGLSLSRFKTKFKEETGTTPRDYINHIKIEQAKQLLRNGVSVTNTALDLGFSTSNYFATLFKKYTGLSPGEFARREKLASANLK